MLTPDILQLGATFCLAMALIELVKFTITKYTNKMGKIIDTTKESQLSNHILSELKLMNSNHLHHIEGAVNEGNAKIVEAINNGNLKMVELLGQIVGKLDK